MQNDNVKFKNFSIHEFIVLAILFLLPFYFIKFKCGWASLNLIEILIIVLFFVWFFNKSTKYQIPDTRYIWPVFFILAGVIFSILVNKNYYIGLGILKGWFLLPIIFAVIFLDNLKKNEKILDWSLTALFYSGVLISVEGIYYWFSGLLTYDGRLRIFFDSPNQLAMYLAPVFIIGAIKLGFEKPLPSRREGGKGRTLENSWKVLSAGVGIILIALNLYLTKSFGSWLALAATLIIVFWLIYREKWSKKYLFITIIIFVIFVGAAGFGKFENIKNLGDRSSLASRAMIWKSAGLMLKNNSLFGIGPGNFQGKYLEYQKYFPPYLEWAVPQPHNLYLAFWLEAGLTGIIGFFWLVKVFFVDNKKAIRNSRLYGILCFAVMFYFLIHGLVDTTYWRNDMAMVFWAVIAVNLYLAENKK